MPHSPAYDFDEALEDPQARHLRIAVETTHPELGPSRTVRPPYSFDGAPDLDVMAPPTLDEHGAEIRADLARRRAGRGLHNNDNGEDKDMKRLTGLLFASALALPSVAAAQETINITVASSHPTTIPWVGFIPSHFMPEVDRILAETGTYGIEWQRGLRRPALQRARHPHLGRGRRDRHRLGVLLPRGAPRCR